MRITSTDLRRIIKEELSHTRQLRESSAGGSVIDGMLDYIASTLKAQYNVGDTSMLSQQEWDAQVETACAMLEDSPECADFCELLWNLEDALHKDQLY